MKVLWFCGAIFSEKESIDSGTWLQAMASNLVNSGTIQLYNISQGPVKQITRVDFLSINQWILPHDSLNKNGLPCNKTIKDIKSIVDEIQPDIIHIWGTEYYWGLLSARGYIKGNIIIEIQGLKFAYEKYFYSGLTFRDIVRCFGIKEFIKPWVSIIGFKYSYRRWGRFEQEILLKHRNISTQSDWVRAYVKNINPEATIFKTSISLRKEFIEATKWEKDDCNPYQVLTSAAIFYPYKGLHVLIDAIAILKNRFPQTKLVIAGRVISGIRQDGYMKWLKKRIIKLGIEDNVVWIGPLDAQNLVLQMHRANVVVVPSFIETYCLALDEALTVGVPTVASFSGAMPELAMHEKTALFFPPGDAAMCADSIARFFEDEEFSKTISQSAYSLNKIKNSSDKGAIQQLIYSNILRNR
ncbi:MAG: glycosyltransferase [Bacteroidota bacterium]|nr:glycosyltransferase [Bacteroidota bacterium]